MFKNFATLALLCFLFASDVSFAQAIIEFNENTFNFGEISEGTVAEHEFVFTNKGNQPLVITSVKASCGCTTPSWTKEPVLPGKTGHIKASYNSKNRPGSFHKSITITSNAATSTKVVYIKGTSVKSIQLEPLFTAEELKKAPRISIDQQHLQLGKVQMGSSVPVNLTVHNQGQSPLEIKGIYSSCRCVSLAPDKYLEIEPGFSDSVELVFTPRSQGEFTYGAHILTNDLVQPKHQVYITATVTPQPDESSVVKEAPSKISF